LAEYRQKVVGNHSTKLSVEQIKQSIKATFPRAQTDYLDIGPLDEPANASFYLDDKPSILGGRGRAHVIVRDRGPNREVTVIALATTVTDGIAGGFAQDVSWLRQPATSKKLAERVLKALR
jgi:hypothetical protein